MKLRTATCNRIIDLGVYFLTTVALGLMMACSSSKPAVETAPVAPSSKQATPEAPHLKVAATDKVIGVVDTLTATPATQSKPARLLANGWAVSCVAGSTVDVVTLMVDGKPVGETSTLIKRPDVASTYDRPDFEQSGWQIDVSLKKLGPGEHPVTVRASNSNGDNTVLPGKTLSIP